MNGVTQKTLTPTENFIYLLMEAQFRRTDLDSPDNLHLLLIVCLWELIDFDFMLLDFFHDLHTVGSKQREAG